MKINQSIASVGYGISGDIGGIQKNKYYTPDGRVLILPPQIREYVVKDREGKVIRSGSRDANLDKGWLLTMPKVLLPYCKGCNRWHDTQKEVDACIKEQKATLERYEKWAKREIKKEDKSKDTQIATMSKELDELKAMVKKLAEAK